MSNHGCLAPENPYRYVHIFSGDIEIETVQTLIAELHQHDKVDLYFYTEGGMVLAMNALLGYMNNHPDLRVFCTFQIFSVGFDIITDFKGKIFLTQDLDFFMVHLADRAAFTTRKYEWDNEKLISYTKKRNEAYLTNLVTNHNLTGEEEELLRNGEDLYLYREDFKRLIEHKPNITIL